MARESTVECPPVSQMRAWSTLAILLLFIILSFVDRNVITLLVDPIRQDLGIDDVTMSLIQGLAFALSYSLFSLPAGWLADHASKRLVLFAGVSIWSLATIACGFATNFAELFAARVGVGIGEATLVPAGYAIIADIFPRRRLTLALGIFMSGTTIGGSLALVIGGYIVQWAEAGGGFAGHRPWQAVFMIIGAPGIVAAFLSAFVADTGHGKKSVERPTPSRHYVLWLRSRARYLLTISGGYGLFTSICYGFSAWTPAYLTRVFGLDTAQVGLTVGPVAGVAGLIGSIAYGWLTDRMTVGGVRDSHYRIILAVVVLETLVVGVAFSWAPTVSALVIMLFLVYLIAPVAPAVVSHLQCSTPAAYRGRTVALFTMVANLIALSTGPSVAAYFTEHIYGGPRHVGLGVASMAALLGPLALVIFLIGMRAARHAFETAGDGEGIAGQAIAAPGKSDAVIPGRG